MREALFAGQTANGFKLGTVTTLGWFWMRVGGCRIAYRGGSMEGVDFENVLAVVEPDADEISLSSYLSHEAGKVYFYVVRCANGWGDIEQTLRAVAKVAIDNDGKLGKTRPNEIVGLRAEQGQDGNVEIVWTYNPMEQAPRLSSGQGGGPAEMRIYGDNGTGEIDYQNPVAVVKYKGRRFYRHRIEMPTDGRYRFAVRAADANGNECESKKRLRLRFARRIWKRFRLLV
ncbi:MAG: hypothetical protein ABSG22_02945 [Sedimentisphaerales bacterium]|jgi:hypothetical protein